MRFTIEEVENGYTVLTHGGIQKIYIFKTLEEVYEHLAYYYLNWKKYKVTIKEKKK